MSAACRYKHHNLDITGSIAMQQNPPPFKRFARERFDGTSVHGHRSSASSRERHASPSRKNPLSDPQHIPRQQQPQSRPMVERDLVNQYSPLSTHSSQVTPVRHRSQGQLQSPHVVSPLTVEDGFSWRLRTSEESQLPFSTVRQRRQYAAFRGEDEPRLLEARANAAIALPHTRLSPYGLAGDQVPRCVSQPNTPSFYPHTQQYSLDEHVPSHTLSRSPTVPGASRRRVRSATRTGEANFTNEEFHLFVQATAGLGPEQSYRNASPLHDALSGEESSTGIVHAPRTDLNMVSPEEETPTTTWALQQAAQMPYGMYRPHQQEAVPSCSSMQRLETSSSSVDLWLRTPSAMLDDEHDVSPIEDELPDYASSQAQAQAAQRIEAARRAQELQRRWRESHP